MLAKLEYHLTDVFAMGRLTGNPLATFLNPGDLSTEIMQAIAKEIGYSETTFVMESGPTSSSHSGTGLEPNYRIRIFTPESEIPFAGHPVLGTAEVIRRVWLQPTTETVNLATGAGVIPVAFDAESGIAWMTQPQPQFLRQRAAVDFAKVLGLQPADFMSGSPSMEITTGFPTWIIPLVSQDSMRRIQIDSKTFRSQFAAYTAAEASSQNPPSSRSGADPIPAQNVLVFALGGRRSEWALEARVFAECYGIPEDPATGSAAGCLAAYLAATKFLGSDSVNVVYGQGLEMGRPSQLHLQVAPQPQGWQLRVGGSVISVAEGRWNIG
jgi:trans-2,3-dihydro-3-hydroxyanthranilate isomerase